MSSAKVDGREAANVICLCLISAITPLIKKILKNNKKMGFKTAVRMFQKEILFFFGHVEYLLLKHQKGRVPQLGQTQQLELSSEYFAPCVLKGWVKRRC